MGKLTAEAAIRLQRILGKRIGRELSEEEVEEAYDALMGFAIALIELGCNELEENPPAKEPKWVIRTTKYPIANTNPNVI